MFLIFVARANTENFPIYSILFFFKDWHTFHTLGKQRADEGNDEKGTTSDNEQGEEAGDAVKGEAGEGSEAGGGGGGETPARQDREGSDDVIRKFQSSSSGVKKPSANQPVVNIPYVPQHRWDK